MEPIGRLQEMIMKARGMRFSNEGDQCRKRTFRLLVIRFIPQGIPLIIIVYRQSVATWVQTKLEHFPGQVVYTLYCL